ncbi:MAG: hypothetical protein IJO63_05215 [Bacilli bacterium]|nr:hypothetical protein [Bacilli bacterium]
MKSKKGKPASRLLATSALVVFLAGCAGNQNMTGAYVGTLKAPIPFESIMANTDEEIFISPGEPIVNGTKPSEPIVQETKPLTKLEAYEQELKSRGQLLNAYEVMQDPEAFSKEDQELAAYQVLTLNGLTISDVADELHNILVYSQYPTCCTPELFEMLVGKLHKTLNYFANPFSSYRVLSQKVHELTCEHTHTEELGIYSCEELKRLGDAVRPKTFEEYLDETMSDDIGYQKIKMALMNNPDHTLDDYLIELENLIIAQQVPSCVPEDVWFELFGKLDATLGKYESLYDTYIGLAVFVHNTLNPEEPLSKNEFGIYVESLEI